MSENKDTHIKVIPGGVGLGGNAPRQYRNMMADYNAQQLLNQTVEQHRPLKPQRPRPKGGKGGCGCGK